MFFMHKLLYTILYTWNEAIQIYEYLAFSYDIYYDTIYNDIIFVSYELAVHTSSVPKLFDWINL